MTRAPDALLLRRYVLSINSDAVAVLGITQLPPNCSKSSISPQLACNYWRSECGKDDTGRGIPTTAALPNPRLRGREGEGAKKQWPGATPAIAETAAAAVESMHADGLELMAPGIRNRRL